MIDHLAYAAPDLPAALAEIGPAAEAGLAACFSEPNGSSVLR
jgi:hypothetical protein